MGPFSSNAMTSQLFRSEEKHSRFYFGHHQSETRSFCFKILFFATFPIRPLSSEWFSPDGAAKIFFLQPHAMAKIQTLVKRVSEPIDGCSTDCATVPRLQNNAAVCQIHHYFLCPLDREMMQPLLPCIIVRYLGWQT